MLTKFYSALPTVAAPLASSIRYYFVPISLLMPVIDYAAPRAANTPRRLLIRGRWAERYAGRLAASRRYII